MRTLVQDVSFSLRSLQRTGGFTFVAILTLSLGIAANTAVFSVVNSVLLRALPYQNPDRLVAFEWKYAHGANSAISAAAYFKLKERAQSFQSIAVYLGPKGINLSGFPPHYHRALRVSANFFSTLGVTPVLGRAFSDADDEVGRPGVSLLSYGLWQQEFNGNPDVLGHEVRIDGENHRVVGVMPKDFRFYPEADLWLPIRLSPATAGVGNQYGVIARLKNGTTPQQAAAELAATREYQETFPLHSMAADVNLACDKLQNLLVVRIRQSLYRLFGAVIFVLLISCTNLALLLKVRASSRTHEFGIRAALGASRPRLVRLFLMDGILITFCGGVIGAILGKEVLPFITRLAPHDLLVGTPLRIDGRVLLFTAGISTVTALLSALPAALKISGASLNDSVRLSSHTTTARELAMGRLLVPAQTGLALFLLTGTVTLLHSFLQLQQTPPGFDSEHVFVAQISLDTPAYKSSAATNRLLDQVREHVRSIPGVETAATVTGLPLERGLTFPIFPAGTANTTVREDVQYRIASPDYFRVLRIPLIAGRFFTSQDGAGSSPVALVSKGFAQQWWPNESPIGRYVTMNSELGSQFSHISLQVVGVVADVRETGLDRPVPPTVFVPASQVPDHIMTLANQLFPASVVIRTTTSTNLYESLAQSLATDDRDLALISVRPLTQVQSNSIARPRFYALLVAVFGTFAVLLCAIGLYGLLSYQLTLRMRELSLRIALGANRLQIIGVVLKHGLRLVAFGILLGALASFFLSKSLATLIYNVSDTRFTSVSLAALLLVTVAFVTSLLISLRTVAIEPMEVLKVE